MPCPDLNELLDLGRGTLDGERADELARHLDLCDVCRALVAEATGGSVRTPPLAEETAGAELDPPEVFPKLGRYVVLDLLSAGGMGVVYAAYDPQLDRKVALKLLRPESLGAETLEQAQARLLREAQAMASLSHPNVVPVFDVGTVGRQVFVAMELIDGGTLTDWLKAERRGWREVVEVFLQAGRGLAAAHAAGIVHRDFKPDNVLVGRDGRARVSDFGLARPAAREHARAAGDRKAGAQESSLAGTPAYMAPEQFEGRGVSARSDQFSFCVALWEALYGRRPFAGQTAEQLAESVLSGATPSPPAGSSVPGWLQRALLRGLSRRPEDRFPFIDGLLDELSRSSVGGRRRRRLAAAAVALSIALAAAFIQLGRHLAQRCEGVGAEVAAVWSSARREALRKAFADANVPYSSGSLRTIEAALDRFAAAWSQRRRVACEAGSEEPQLRCLRRQLVDLRALLGRLESGDRAAIESGAAAASRLAFESACVGSLGVSAEEPLEVLEALAQTEAALLTGATGDALALAKKGRELAAGAGDPALETRALIGLAAAHAEQGDLAAAEESALEATTLAVSAGLPALAAHAWGQLVFVTGLQQGRAAEAGRLARHAFAFLEAAGGDAATEARLVSLVGRLAALQGDHDRAAGAFEREIALRAREGNEADPALAEVYADLARARLAGGRASRAEAVEHAAQAVRIGETALGAAHPWIGRWLLTLGEARLAAGQGDEALQAFARASSVFGQNEGDRWRAPWALIGQARALRGADQVQEALERLEQARSIARAYPGRSPSLEAELQLARGEVLLRSRRFEQALESFERAKTLAAELAPATLAAANLGIGRAHLEAGDPAKAIGPLEAAKRHGIESGAAELEEIEVLLARALEQSGRASKAQSSPRSPANKAAASGEETVFAAP